MSSSLTLSCSQEDCRFMKEAIRLASKGTGFVSPNPLVGALVVRDGKIVGRGFHEKFGGPHAEVNALRDAREKARGATLYVTLEPCNHHGKTPPCTVAILESGVKRVVIGMMDPNPDVKGGGAKVLKEHGIEVVCGVLEEECKRQNEIFLKFVSHKIPFVIAKIAATLDGKIATRDGDSKWITGEKSRAMGHRLRQRVAAILVGIETVLSDDPMLTVRLENVVPSHPARFIFDYYGRTPLDSKLVKSANDVPVYLVVSDQLEESKLEKFYKAGVKVWKIRGKEGHIDSVAFLQRLGQEGFDSLLVEGGAAVHGSFFDAGLIDKIFFFYAPKILGGSRSRPMVGGKGISSMSKALKVRHLEVKRIDDDILVTGYLQGFYGNKGS